MHKWDGVGVLLGVGFEQPTRRRLATPEGATHLRSFLVARWCASRPSDRLCNEFKSTWVVGAETPPNQRTHTLWRWSAGATQEEEGGVGVGGGGTNLPGHEGDPLAGPHTRSPSTRLTATCCSTKAKTRQRSYSTHSQLKTTT